LTSFVAHRNSPIGRYRRAIRDGADPDPWASEEAHRWDGKAVPRSPSTVFGGEFRDRYPTMTWQEAWPHMRVSTDRPPFLDVDQAYAGFHRNR
jgi:hypothetical protein